MLWEAIRGEEEGRKRTDITRGIPLLTLSIATSIDSLGVGLSLAFVESKVWLAALIVGSVCFLITAAGFYTGKRVGGWLGRWADALGGLVLIGIGIRIPINAPLLITTTNAINLVEVHSALCPCTVKQIPGPSFSTPALSPRRASGHRGAPEMPEAPRPRRQR
jgi:hypothetical protein